MIALQRPMKPVILPGRSAIGAGRSWLWPATCKRRSWPNVLLRWRRRAREGAMPNARPVWLQTVVNLQNALHIQIGVVHVHAKTAMRSPRAVTRPATSPTYRMRIDAAARRAGTSGSSVPGLTQASPGYQVQRAPSFRMRQSNDLVETAKGGSRLLALSVRNYKDIDATAATAAAGKGHTALPFTLRTGLMHSGYVRPRERQYKHALSTTESGVTQKSLALIARMTCRMRREEIEMRTEQHVINRMPRPASMVWRRSEQSASSDGTTGSTHAYSPATARISEASTHVAASGGAQAATNRNVTGTLPLDSASVDRLAEDVLRRVDRRLRIERERRGM